MGIEPADTLLGGLLVHLLLCSVVFTAGCGILRVLRIGASEAAALTAPFLTLVFLTLLLGSGVGLGTPVCRLAPWLWSATAILMAIGFPAALRSIRSYPRLIVAAMLLPVATMGDCYWQGLASYARMGAHDGWSYVALSKYLWEYPRGTEGGLAEILQYGSALGDTRFISPALLGVLSPLVRVGDPQSVMLLFQSFAIYVAASAVAAFWLATTERRDFALCAATAFAVSGWMTNMLIVNNFDNLLCLAYMPGIAVLWQLFAGRWFSWSLAVGCAIAAVVYTYPELAPVAITGAALISLPNIVGDLPRVRPLIGSGISLLTCAAVLLVPYSVQLSTFLRHQFNALAATAGRPGDGFFDGLVAPAQYPGAFWGLGNEFYRHRAIDNVLGYGLSACLIVGVAALCLRPKLRGVPAAIGLTICGALVMVIGRGYAYGAYKFIALGWWLYAAAALVGFESIIGRVHNPTFSRRAVRVVGVAAVLCLALVLVDRRKYCHSAKQSMSLAECRKLEEIGALTKGSTVIVDVDGAFAGIWATYFLRDCDTLFTHHVGYMLSDTPRMDRARAVDPNRTKFLLTDHQPDRLPAGTEVVWQSGEYRLWRYADRVPALVAFSALDGEFPKWEPTIPLAADRGTQVRIIAAQAGRAQLQLAPLSPSADPAAEFALVEVGSSGAPAQIVPLKPDRNIVDIEVATGRNDFRLRLVAAQTDELREGSTSSMSQSVTIDIVELRDSELRDPLSLTPTRPRLGHRP